LDTFLCFFSSSAVPAMSALAYVICGTGFSLFPLGKLFCSTLRVLI
jgi:hypothetical protein